MERDSPQAVLRYYIGKTSWDLVRTNATLCIQYAPAAATFLWLMERRQALDIAEREREQAELREQQERAHQQKTLRDRLLRFCGDFMPFIDETGSR